MADDGGMAFARLFSQRRRELDLSVVDLAVRTARPIELVVAWDQGTALPDGDDLDKVADILKLPKPLLTEALRLVTDHRVDFPRPDPFASADPEDDATGSTPMSREALITTPYPATAFTERLRRLPDEVIRSFVAMFSDLRRSWSRKRRLARAPTAFPLLHGGPRPTAHLPAEDGLHGGGRCGARPDPALVTRRSGLGGHRPVDLAHRGPLTTEVPLRDQ